MSDWSAEQYSKFERERTLPAIDLANAIMLSEVRSIIDIGCGIGNSTAVLKRKFPEAEIIGVDNSDDMLKTAMKNNQGIEFIKLDVGNEISRISSRFDIVFSNACIQWIPEHRGLLKNLMSLLNENGILAIQIPQQTKHPMQKVIKSVAQSKKWKEKITTSRSFYSLTEDEYFCILSDLSNDFRIWETTYFHDMPSHKSIVEWYKGTGMRPFLNQLNDADKIEFENDVLSETEKVYPVQNNNRIIFRFPRLFFCARNI